MKPRSYIILFILASLLCSCEPEPLGPVHIRIEAYTIPEGQPAPNENFMLIGVVKGYTFEEPWLVHDMITLKTNANGIIDTVINETGSQHYGLDPYNDSTTLGYNPGINTEGSYTYYVGFY